MRASRKMHPPGRARAFTLIEAVLALAISAVVLAAIGGVFYSALRLRDRSVAMLDEGSRLQPVLTILKRDLAGAMQPEGVMASVFRCGSIDSPMTAGVGIQLITTTGALESGGDLQEVTYSLQASSQGGRGSKDLVRTVNRNLLGTMVDLPPEEVLLSGVDLFEVDCFDGNQWRNSWDSTLTDTNLPIAIRVQIQLAPQGDNSSPSSLAGSPIEIIVPLGIQSRTNMPSNSAAVEGDET